MGSSASSGLCMCQRAGVILLAGDRGGEAVAASKVESNSPPSRC